MLILIKKAAGNLKTTTATKTLNATDFIATGKGQASAGAAFHAKPCAGIDRRQYRAARHRDKIFPGAQNTTKQAGNLPDSEVFSRPEFKVLGVGIAYPQGRQHNLFCVLNPHTHPECLKSAKDGFLVRQGTETMTTVNTIITPQTGNTATLARQQAIENALSTALYFIRLPSTDSGLRAATGRAIRAASMLKQACAEISNGERV